MTQATLSADYPVADRRPRTGPPLSAAGPRLRASLQQITKDPLGTLAWVLASALVLILAPVWGVSFTMIGWMSARRRLRTDGLIGLGDALVPAMAGAQFEDGLFSGVWRVQKLSIAVMVVQFPTVLLALLPALIAYAMFMPALAAFPGAIGMILAWGVPSLVALVALLFVAAEQLLVYRILSASGPRYSIGLVYRAVGQAWRATLDEGRLLFGLSLGLGAAAVAASAFVGVSGWVADLLELGGGALLVLTWTGAVVGVLFLAIVYETLAGWAESVRIERVEAPTAFSFSGWAVAWMKSVAELPVARGAVTIGLITCLVVGLLTSLGALATGTALTSWLGLGWFAVTAGTLLLLHRQGRSS